MSSSRPKILKLHGDFLFDNIRNTSRELESLEENMRDKFGQYAREFGLIVIGYSGCDRSVMEIIESLLNDKDNFSQGVFWCVPRHTVISTHVDRLTRFERFHVVEIGGFDAFMAELHEELKVIPHPVIDNPYRALGIRMTRMLNTLPERTEGGEMHAILKRDLIALGNSVRDEEKLKAIPRPHNCMAFAARDEHEFDQAGQHVLNQLADSTSTIFATYTAFYTGVEILPHQTDAKFGRKLVDAFTSSRVVENFPQHFEHKNSMVVKLLEYGELDLGLEVLDLGKRNSGGVEDEYSAINRAQILARRRQRFSTDLRSELRKISQHSTTPLAKFGAKIVLRKSKQAVDEIEGSVDSTGKVGSISIDEILRWPICDLLSDVQRRRLEQLRE